MEKNNILDYEQVQEKLKILLDESNGTIQKQNDLATTKFGLPIEHYTIGHGKKEFVITGSMHGSEIITTDFVLKLMEEMTKSDGRFKNINLEDEYTFHFIPMLCPEGYLITTSAVRTRIPREMSQDEAEKICKEYWSSVRNDDINLKGDHVSPRKAQEMFKDSNWSCIPEKYQALRENVKKIYEQYPDLPRGSMINWSANGSGIDINANSKNNQSIPQILEGEKVFPGNGRQGSLDYSHPGPVNCPMDKTIGYEEQIETKAIRNLLSKLNEKGTLAGYENYHGTGGMIYQRPCRDDERFSIGDNLYWERLVNNIFAAYSYQNQTVRQYDKEGNPQKYMMLTGDAKVSTVNDELRMLYNEDLLIELSGMGGNPIAPYGDINGNYSRVINSNLDSFAEYIQNYDIINKISKKALNAFTHIFSDFKKEKGIKERDLIIRDEIEKGKETPIDEKKGIYRIAELMVKETHDYIKEGKIDELNELLEHGFFSDKKEENPAIQAMQDEER